MGELFDAAFKRRFQDLEDTSCGCAYCGTESDSLQWEHIIPRDKGGPDTIDNLVMACSSCNATKGARDPFEWYAGRRAEIPRIVLGKLLKQLLAAHTAAGTLAWTEYPMGQGLKAAQLVRVFTKPGSSATGGCEESPR